MSLFQQPSCAGREALQFARHNTCNLLQVFHRNYIPELLRLELWAAANPYGTDYPHTCQAVFVAVAIKLQWKGYFPWNCLMPFS